MKKKRLNSDTCLLEPPFTFLSLPCYSLVLKLINSKFFICWKYLIILLRVKKITEEDETKGGGGNGYDF